MIENKLKVLLFLIVGLILLGFILPALISAKSTMLVVLGVSLFGGYLWAGYQHILPTVIKLIEGDKK